MENKSTISSFIEQADKSDLLVLGNVILDRRNKTVLTGKVGDFDKELMGLPEELKQIVIKSLSSVHDSIPGKVDDQMMIRGLNAQLKGSLTPTT